jgi:hypothetical protein
VSGATSYSVYRAISRPRGSWVTLIGAPSTQFAWSILTPHAGHAHLLLRWSTARQQRSGLQRPRFHARSISRIKRLVCGRWPAAAAWPAWFAPVAPAPSISRTGGTAEWGPHGRSQDHKRRAASRFPILHDGGGGQLALCSMPTGPRGTLTRTDRRTTAVRGPTSKGFLSSSPCRQPGMGFRSTHRAGRDLTSATSPGVWRRLELHPRRGSR